MAQPILDLIGGEIEAYDSLPPETWGHVEMDGKKHPWGVWGDLLYAAEGTKVLAKRTMANKEVPGRSTRARTCQ